jgi:hypothetical protein
LTTEFDTFDFSKSDIVVDDITRRKNSMMLQILMSVSIQFDSPLVRLDAYGLQFVYHVVILQMRYMVV